MATILDENVHVSFPITKFEETDDGHLLVYGKATDGSVDSDDQIVDPDWSAKALKTWMETGPNVRVQHNAKRDPAGVGVSLEIDRDGDGGHWVKSKVVEPIAKDLVKHGGLRAYSVGIARASVERDLTGKARGGIIKGGEIFEVSLVDRPANKNCSITLVKSEAGGDWETGDLDALLRSVTDGTVTKAASGGDADGDGDGDGAGADTDAADDAEAAKGDTGGSADADSDGGQDRDGDDDAGAAEADAAGTADADGEKAATVDVTKGAWSAERAAWLAREPKIGKAVDGTDFLARRAEWQRWSAEGAEAGLSEDGYPLWVAKRDMDRNVGDGGVDRDKLKASDFVFGDDRAFPVVTPGDVSDAVSSWGRYKGDHSFEQFKANLTALCKRKGEAFVKELPESWHVKAVEADIVKGGKDCPECGTPFHSDSKLRTCSNCGADLPNAKSEKADAGDEDAPGENGADADGDGDPDGKLAPPFKPKKGKGGKAKKAAKADNGGRAVPGTKPAGAHREPDGDAVEDLEHDAGMHTDPDSTSDKVPASVKSAAPYAVARMHDALCAAYSWDTVAAEYPALKGVADAVDEMWLLTEVAKAAQDGDAGTVAELAAVVATAQSLSKGGHDPALLADARAGLHKAFGDMYPNEHVSPSAMSPGRFQRPYLSAGHQPAKPGGGPRLPVPSHVPDAGQFDRGPVTAGHQDAPHSDGTNSPTYAAASRQATQNILAALHDHIAARFPDNCPLAGTSAPLPAGNRADARPTPVTPPATAKAPGEKTTAPEGAVTKSSTKKGKGKKRGKAGRPVDVDALVSKAVAEAVAEVTKSYEPKIAAMQATIDELGAQPDPTKAPVRGVVRKAAASDDKPAPVERVNLVEKAQADAAATERAQMVSYLTRMADPVMGHPDAMVREQAHSRLQALLNT